MEIIASEMKPDFSVLWLKKKRKAKRQCLHSSVQLHSEVVCIVVTIVKHLFSQLHCQSISFEYE